jgi:hypothetical protein
LRNEPLFASCAALLSHTMDKALTRHSKTAVFRSISLILLAPFSINPLLLFSQMRH